MEAKRIRLILTVPTFADPYQFARACFRLNAGIQKPVEHLISFRKPVRRQQDLAPARLVSPAILCTGSLVKRTDALPDGSSGVRSISGASRTKRQRLSVSMRRIFRQFSSTG